MDTRRTILFADVRDSTGLTEKLGDVGSRELIGALMQELTAATEANNGVVIKTIGDEIMSSFESAHDAASAAIDMQRGLAARPTVSGVRPQIGVGFNSGTVVLEGGDVFGDVVNVAARLVSHAVATQILTTDATMAEVADPDIVTRSLGEHTLKGREEPVDLCELLWRGETAQLTTLGPKLVETPRTSIDLTLGERVVHLDSDAMPTLEVGRSEECDLVVPTSSASRKHAKITSRGGRFYLVDHSTNGTYVKQADGSELVVHSDEVLLTGSGHIRLGDPLTEAGPLDIAFVVGDG